MNCRKMVHYAKKVYSVQTLNVLFFKIITSAEQLIFMSRVSVPYYSIFHRSDLEMLPSLMPFHFI